MKKLHIKKITDKLVDESFRDGHLIESKVLRSIKILKIQSTTQAIFSLSEYLKALRRKQREYTLYAETVIPLSSIQLKKIKKIVEKKVKITKVVTNINPEILGGFKLQVGDEIWDQSILAKLSQIREAIVYGRPN